MDFYLRCGLAASLSIIIFAACAAAQDAAKIKAGEETYNNYCATCHGDNLVNTGPNTFDLRRLTANDRARFENSVLNGKNQMPPWKGVVTPEQVEELWQFIRSQAAAK